MKFLILILMLCNIAYAQYTPNPRADLGLGLQKVGDYVDVLFQTKGYFSKSNSDIGKYYILRFKAEGAANSEFISSVSTEISLVDSNVTFEEGSSYLTFGVSLLDYQYNRNIDINQFGTHSLTLVGLKAVGAVSLDNKSNVRLFAKAAISTVSLFMQSERYDDGVQISGREFGERNATTYNAELGLQLYKKFKISYGIKGQQLNALGESYYTGEVCQEYYDSYYDEYYLSCYDTYATDYRERHGLFIQYLKVSLALTDRLSLFGKYARRTFFISDDTGFFESSINSANYFQLGASYRFGGKSKKSKLQ